MTDRRIPRVIVAIAAACLVFPLAATWWAKTRPAPAPPFAFPTAELAALDRDLQARFAVVPDKDFGIERTYGNQHYLIQSQHACRTCDDCGAEKAKD